MKNITKNQHYVPQSYIKRFADDGNLSVYFKKSGIIKNHQNSANYASKRFFYDTTSEELKSVLQEFVISPYNHDLINWEDQQFIEHYLGKEESEIVNVLSDVENDPQLLGNDSYMAKIIIFIHSMMYRNIEYRNINEQINKITYDYLRQYDDITSFNWIEETYGHGKAKINQLKHLTSLSSVLQTNEILSRNYDYFFARSANGVKFIISDNPVPTFVLDIAEFCFPFSANSGVIFRKKNVSSPLMTNDKPDGLIINVSAKNVYKLNVLQYGYANRYLFGDYKNLSAIKMLIDMYEKDTMVRKVVV